jgi:hypothetical protein
MIIWYFQSRQNGIVVVVVEVRLDNSTVVKAIICINRNIIHWNRMKIKPNY